MIRTVVTCGSVGIALIAAALVVGCSSEPIAPKPSVAVYLESEPDEKHLTNLRQLTSGGENAEAYFSADGQQLI